VGHQGVPAIAVDLVLAPPGRAGHGTSEHPHEQLDPTLTPRAYAYDHAHRVDRGPRRLGIQAGVSTPGEGAFAQLGCAEYARALTPPRAADHADCTATTAGAGAPGCGGSRDRLLPLSDGTGYLPVCMEPVGAAGGRPSPFSHPGGCVGVGEPAPPPSAGHISKEVSE